MKVISQQKGYEVKEEEGACGKIKVFGFLIRRGKVYTEIIDNVSAKTLQGIIRGKVQLSSVYSYRWLERL